uniref:RanBP2-type domain-containing protein n=1 Tax=Clastoptera arizonana TaxID=38151 RepID=A0A1B6D5H0_9HEMI
MQIMAEYMVRDRMHDLWQQIEHQHLSYLHADESPRKLDEKKRLDGYIKEFLSVVPHERKFYFRETSEVLHRSVESKEDFSAYRATAAWTAIAAYAHNLLAQPWRKEYHEIKTYCGYYKHNIESSLVGGELMLEAMGYKHSGRSTLVLDGPVDPDRVTIVSRDSLVALVECQIMRSIYAEVIKTLSSCTWLEVLQYRETYAGAIDQAIRGLTFRMHQKRYEEQQYRGHLESYGTVSRYHHPMEPCPYAASRYYNPLHTTPRYGVISPQTPVPPSYPVYHIKPHELYAPNNYYHVQNGYIPLPVPPPPVVIPSYVPTAQLIELDAPGEQQVYSGNTHRRSSSDHRLQSEARKVNDRYQTDLYNKSTFTDDASRKTNKNKDGSWDWGYVYQKLEEKNSKRSEEPEKVRRPPSPLDLGDALKGFSLDDLHQISVPESKTLKINEALNKIKIDNEIEQRKKDVNNRISIYDNSSPPSTNFPNQTQTLAREIKRNDVTDFHTVDNRKSRVKPNHKWECITCTYHNSGSTEVCEICGKSRSKGGESKPLASGGRQCPHCTLVNEKGVTTCDACGSSLKDSPTYI